MKNSRWSGDPPVAAPHHHPERNAVPRIDPSLPGEGPSYGIRVALVIATVSMLVVGSRTAASAAAGDPLPNLSPAHLGWFAQGLDEFNQDYVPATGLGPSFNAVSCVGCHNTPAPGGGSTFTVTRFGRSENGTFDPLTSFGGPLLQAAGIDPSCAETIPPEANVVTERMTTPMFGAGLIEAILDEDITRAADPDDRNHDGISGRVNRIPYPGRFRVGRFGWKSHEATILSFTAEALVTEMGITNSLFPGEVLPGGSPTRLAACEPLEGVPDPDDVGGESFSALVAMTNFTRLLAPPVEQRRPRGRGWAPFRRAGCDDCHTARQKTGPHTIPALAFKTIYPFSDFLLHDMGSLGDGMVDNEAGPTEMRTAPLWGIAARTRYLHDGRATTLLDAIIAHDGEGAAARERFLALSVKRQAALLEFLGSR